MIKTIDTENITEEMLKVFTAGTVGTQSVTAQIMRRQVNYTKIKSLLDSAPAVEPAQAVPVGYVHNGISRLLKARGGTIIREKHDEFFDTPMYLHPAPPEPLTDEQIDNLLVAHGKGDDGFRSFARAIEKEHGILGAGNE